MSQGVVSETVQGGRRDVHPQVMGVCKKADNPNILTPFTMPVRLLMLFAAIIGNIEGAVRPVVFFNPNWDKIFTGESLNLTCNVDSVGREDQKYIWYKDDKLLSTGSKQFLIESAETIDSGNYQCQTTTSDRSDAVKLDVTYDWIILQVPQSVYEGDDVSLRCHRNQEDPTGGKIVFYNKENTIIQKSEIDLIFFQNVSMSMVGEYQCAAGSATDSAKGTLYVRELFSNPLVNVSQYPVTEGVNVTLTCDTALSPHRAATELQFAFYRDGQNVQEFGLSNKYQIQSVQLQDAGDYTCQVKTATDTVRKESITRHVQIQELFLLPQIKLNLQEVMEGAEMTLTCDTVPKCPTDLMFAFYRDEEMVQGFNSSNMYQVQSAQLKDSGKYTCEVRTSNYTVKKRSHVLHIQVQGRTLSETPVM
ncbi:Fc receptor-like protein 3 [Pelobates fuscus]|uniref:Fc receptor-like protein 3 n=1 Tax=Pelobates fuscus TaxID=191477 RepID=UPI002FE4C77C